MIAWLGGKRRNLSADIFTKVEWLVQLPMQRFETDFITYNEYYDQRMGKNISTKSDAEIIEIARETERYFNGD